MIIRSDLIRRLSVEKLNKLACLAGMPEKHFEDTEIVNIPSFFVMLIYRAAEGYNLISRDSQITIDQDYVEFIGFSTIRNVRVNTYFHYEDYESGFNTPRELALLDCLLEAV